MSIKYRKDLKGVDWEVLRQTLIADNFHNGHTTAQLQLSFENSPHVVMVWDGDELVATARALSDGVGNGYIIDIWTHSKLRRHGIGTRMVEVLTKAMPGQHVYLQTDDAMDFYKKLGFVEQPVGLRKIVGKYLKNETRR